MRDKRAKISMNPLSRGGQGCPETRESVRVSEVVLESKRIMERLGLCELRNRMGVMDAARARSMLDLMVNHEEAMAELYETFVESVPEIGDFWRQMVHEEKRHADILRNLTVRLRNGVVFLNTRRFSFNELRRSLASLKKQIQKVRNGGTTVLESLALAHDFEKSIVEKRFFQVFGSDSPEMKESFEMLRNHCEEHAGRIRTALEEARMNGGC